MRTTISLGVILLAAMGAPNASAFTSTGTLERVTPSRNEVRLRDGDAYRLPAHIDLSGYRAGEKVHVSWDSQDPSILSEGSDEYIRLLDATSIRAAER